MYPFETYLGYLPPSPFDIVYGKQQDGARIHGDEQKARKFVDEIRHMHIRV
jgi:hypothetical protein